MSESEIIIHTKEITLVPLDEIKLNPKNRNIHTDEQIERLAKIYEYQGFRNPGTISNRSGILIAGEGRYRAAQLRGMKAIPCIFQDFEDEAQELAYGISENAISEWSILDRAGINADLADIGPIDLDLLGMKEFTLDPIPFENDEDQEDEEFSDEEKSEEEKEKQIEENEQIPEKIDPRTKENDHFRIGMHQLYNGDCLERMKLLENESVDSLVSDPPAGISFMSKSWDDDKGGSKEWIAWMSRVMQQAFRVLKPGAHGLVWAIPRTSHWTATALEDAGFEIRDVVTHLFGSGFPKSMDISKAIDKQAGAEREVIGTRTGVSVGNTETYSGKGNCGFSESEFSITTPSTPEAKQWQGWGTSLKPASEHWLLVRKPISEDTVAKNVIKFGTGGINIDVSRIGTHDNLNGGAYSIESERNPTSYLLGSTGKEYKAPSGRFPSNLLLSHNSDCVEVGVKKVKGGSGWSKTGSKESENTSMNGKNYDREPKPDNFVNPDGTETIAAFECTEGCPIKLLDEQSGDLGKSQGGNDRFRGGYHFKDSGKGKPCGFGDSGGASRFFQNFLYCAKPSKSEKNDGCEGLPEKESQSTGWSGESMPLRQDGSERKMPKNSNTHPTVKSLKLMSYLINMITPPNGTLLDCFGGSGTTLVAAHLNGFRSILFEQSCEYCDIILARAEKVTQIKGELINGNT